MPRLLILVSLQSFDKSVTGNQDTAFSALKDAGVPFDILDGADPTNKQRRNELFGISGLRAKYPQFFFVSDDKQKTEFWGDWGAFEGANEQGNIGAVFGGGSSTPRPAVPQEVPTTKGSSASHSALKTATPQNHPASELSSIVAGSTLLVLLSNQSLQREITANQERATTVLKGMNVSFETIDGADPSNRERRNELFSLSGLRGKYPQFFRITSDNKTEFCGDWDWFMAVSESGQLSKAIPTALLSSSPAPAAHRAPSSAPTPTHSKTGAKKNFPMLKIPSTGRELQDIQNQALRAMTESDQNDIHVVFVSHGLYGTPHGGTGYVMQTLQVQADGLGYGDNVMVYNLCDNEGKTTDGIAAGGRRMADEVNAVLDQLIRPPYRKISVSFIGYSLGGLYSRFALSILGPKFSRDRITPKVFATLATPHLGVDNNTLVPIPPFLQSIVARSMGTTGSNLLRFASGKEGSVLIDDMATQPQFVKPLKSFEHRLAYINAYQTDFQVSVSTAGFLGTVTHKVRVKSHQRVSPPTLNPFEAGRYRTTSCSAPEVASPSSSTLSLDDISKHLDNIGWTKVFCDIRSGISSLGFGGIRKISLDPTKPSEMVSPVELLQRYDAIPQGTKRTKAYGHSVLVAHTAFPQSRNNPVGQQAMDFVAREVLDLVVGKKK